MMLVVGLGVDDYTRIVLVAFSSKRQEECSGVPPSGGVSSVRGPDVSYLRVALVYQCISNYIAAIFGLEQILNACSPRMVAVHTKLPQERLERRRRLRFCLPSSPFSLPLFAFQLLWSLHYMVLLSSSMRKAKEQEATAM